MAITATPTATDLILVMDNGTGASGQQLTISRTFGDVKPAATHADIYSVAQSLLGLQSKTNVAIQRRDFNEIADV
ncbi:MAG: DUF1659 domain-containing protein [Syntrophomonadaceae bacterium]